MNYGSSALYEFVNLDSSDAAIMKDSGMKTSFLQKTV